MAKNFSEQTGPDHRKTVIRQDEYDAFRDKVNKPRRPVEHIGEAEIASLASARAHSAGD